MYPRKRCRRLSDQSRVTMPIFSFCVVVGVDGRAVDPPPGRQHALHLCADAHRSALAHR